MPISGSDVAPLEARCDVARVGATRCGYYTPYQYVTIGGSEATGLELETLTWTEELDDKPDKLVFEMSNEGPNPITDVGIKNSRALEVKLAVGAPDHFVFGGTAQKVTVENIDPTQDAFGRRWRIEAQDYKRDLRRMLITRPYSSDSASDIALDILTFSADDDGDDANRVFTGNHIEAGLPTIDDITFKKTTADKAMTRLAERLDAHWYIDAVADLHFFTGSESIYPSQDLSSVSAWDIKVSWDDAKSVQHGEVEFRGGQIAAAAAVGDTTITVEEGDAFELIGGGIIGAHGVSWGNINGNVLEGVTWSPNEFGNFPDVTYEAGEYLGQLAAASGASLDGTYERTTAFRRDRRMSLDEATEQAETLIRDVAVTVSYQTRSLTARVGAKVDISGIASSYLSTAGTEEDADGNDRVITKQSTKWISSTVIERKVEAGIRPQRTLRTFFGKVGDDGVKD